MSRRRPRGSRIVYGDEDEEDFGTQQSPGGNEAYGSEHEEGAEEGSNAQYRTDSVIGVVRMIISRHSKYQMVRREHISQAINQVLGENGREDGHRSNRGPGYNKLVLDEAKQDMKEIFGMDLVHLPTLKGDSGEEETNKRRKTNNDGKTKISTKSNGSMGLRLYTGDLISEVDNERNTNDAQFYLPKYYKLNTPSSNMELIKMGIILLIIGILIIQENHINEQDLVKILKKFGISDNLNHKIPNLNMNLTEFINELIRKDYIIRSTPKSKQTETTNGSFSLGVRTFMELDPKSIFEIIKDIYGDNFDLDTKRKTVVTIERTYGESIQFQDEAEEDGQEGQEEDGQEGQEAEGPETQEGSR
ncbi:hypothetical protein QCA50_019647 [Cerrena zonata]|uniref:MAGE domain-containing protein n=1 Tax=Cerrena zonata TaxID=2478898 RepID=A0AAW0FJN7_9APHY